MISGWRGMKRLFIAQMACIVRLEMMEQLSGNAYYKDLALKSDNNINL